MEFVMENIPALALSFVVPFSTVAAVAIGCGDNRQHAHKRQKRSNGQPVVIGNNVNNMNSSHRQPGQHHRSHQPGKHHSSRSSSKGSSKHGSASSKHGSKKESRPPASKQEMKQKLKESAKESSKKNSSGKEKTKHAIASKLPKKENTLSQKKISSAVDTKKAASAEEAGRSSVSKSGSSFVPRAQLKNTKCGGRKVCSVDSAKYDLIDIVMEPQHLNYSAKGGLQKITLRSNDPNRQAIKVKCSDNNLYRVNPVYTFLEPGKSVSLNVYRNSNAGNNMKADKLVLALAKVSNSEKEPMKAFEGRNSKHPKLVMPLLVSGSNDKDARCPCVK